MLCEKVYVRLWVYVRACACMCMCVCAYKYLRSVSDLLQHIDVCGWMGTSPLNLMHGHLHMHSQTQAKSSPKHCNRYSFQQHPSHQSGVPRILHIPKVARGVLVTCQMMMPQATGHPVISICTTPGALERHYRHLPLVQLRCAFRVHTCMHV